MRKYKHIYFDLDRTIWDFDANSKDTFSGIYEKYELGRFYKDFEHYFRVYTKNNDYLWDLYREGKIVKNVLSKLRFEQTLEEVGVKDDELAANIGKDYIGLSPTKKQLFPGSHEILSYLKEKYNLHIITNGFKEVQYIKLSNCGLDKYFDKVFISEEIGYKKPHPEIFRYAITSVNAKKTESIMIGDDYNVDVIGAKDFGIDQVFFNPHKEVQNTKNITHEISSLLELKEIL
jgi:putative hydrolase of the HAD superfamily